MKYYKLKLLTYNNPILEFTSDEITSLLYDILENDFNFNETTITVDLTQFSDEFKQLNADASNIITDVDVNDSTASFGATLLQPNNLSAGDYVTIENEIVEVLGVTGTTVTFGNRGRWNTKKRPHLAMYGETITIHKNGRYSIIGTEAELYDESNNLLGIVYIKDIQSSGAGLHLDIAPILDRFNKDMVFSLRQVEHTILGVLVTDLLEYAFKDLIVFDSNFKDKLYALYKQAENGILLQINPIETLKTLLLYTSSYLYQNGSLYYVKKLDLGSVFSSAPTDLNIYDVIDMEGGYTSALKNITAEIDLKYKCCKEEYEEVFSHSVGYGKATGQTDKIEIDLTALDDRDNGLGRQQLIIDFFAFRGLFLGHISLDITESANVQVGQKYTLVGIEKIDEIVTFVNDYTDVVALCYSRNEEQANFVLFYNVLSNPISPAIVVKVIDSETLEATNITADLFTSDSTLETAVNTYYNYLFFKQDDEVVFKTIKDYIDAGNNVNIIDIVNNTITVDAHGLTVGGYFIMQYDPTGILSEYAKHLRALGGKV